MLHPQFDDFNEIIENDLEPNIYSFRILKAFLSKSQKHPFHIKFNTGLNRLGFSINDIDRLHNVLGSNSHIKYIFSHLGASEDLEEKKFTLDQINLFEKIIEKIENKFCKKFNNSNVKLFYYGSQIKISFFRNLPIKFTDFEVHSHNKPKVHP